MIYEKILMHTFGIVGYMSVWLLLSSSNIILNLRVFFYPFYDEIAYGFTLLLFHAHNFKV